MAANLSIAPGIAYSGYPVPLYGPNLLSPASSSFEDGSTGAWTNTNATIANSLAQAFDGTHSIALTSIASGSMQISIPAVSSVPVIGGQTYTLSARFYPATTTRTVNFAITWLDIAGGALTNPNGGNLVEASAVWNFTYFTAQAPINAYSCRPVCIVQATAAGGEVQYIDLISFNQGVFYPT